MERRDRLESRKRFARNVATALAVITALVHFLVGGQDALKPMLLAGLPAPSEGAMHAVWHIVTVFLFWSAVVFYRGGEIARHIAGLWVASAIVFIYVGLLQSGLSGLLVNPQWTILGITGLLAFLSAQQKPASVSVFAN